MVKIFQTLLADGPFDPDIIKNNKGRDKYGVKNL